MRVLLINPPYQTITSNYGVGHQTPLGLLVVGGPLIDAGHEIAHQTAPIETDWTPSFSIITIRVASQCRYTNHDHRGNKMDRPWDYGEQYKPIELLISENYAKVFERGLFSQEEYFFSFTIGLLDGSEETWDYCFDTMPPKIDRQAFLRYLRDEIEACDFEPHPTLHIPVRCTDEDARIVDMIKQELKPKYMDVVAYAKRRLCHRD